MAHEHSDTPPAEPPNGLTALILAGGRARRLGGLDKCSLTLAGESLLERRIGALRPLVSEIVVVGGNGSPMPSGVKPAFPAVRLTSDDPDGAGPLGGLHAGLRESRTPWTFATACDMPFLDTGLFRHLLARRDGHDAVVPAVRGWYEPLFAFYHVRCLGAIRSAILRGDTQMASFYPAIRACFVAEQDLRTHDLELLSFFNVNTPEDLERARELSSRGLTRLGRQARP